MTKYRAYNNATIIIGDSSIDDIKKGTILVDEKGKITAIGGKVTIPTDCEVVDLEGKYIMPGLINAHLHYFLNGAPRKDMAGNSTNNLLKLLHTRLGKAVIKSMYKKNVATSVHSGVTTAREVGSFFNNGLAMKKLISEGKIEGPRIICSGGIICITGGHGCDFPGTTTIDGEIEGIKAVRERCYDQVDAIKICSTGGVTDAKYVGGAGALQMNVNEIEAICKEAHKHGYLVASHCESTIGMRDCLAAGIDTIEHGATIEDDMVDLFLHNPKTLRGYTCLIPTIVAGSELYIHKDYLTKSDAHDIIIENSKIIMEGCINGLKTAVEKGIKVGIGTDASVPFVAQYNTWTELLYIQQHTGLSNKRIIEMAIKDTSEILDIDQITGVLKVGKAADFIVLNKNPLDDIRNIKKPAQVIADGHWIKKPSYKEIDGVTQ